MDRSNTQKNRDLFYQYYDEIKAEHTQVKSALQQTYLSLKNNLNGRPLVLYGAGFFAGPCLSQCKKYGLAVACLCDTYKQGIFEGPDGVISIIDQQTLLRDFADASILISTSSYADEITSSLIQKGFASHLIFTSPPFAKLTINDFERHLEGYAWAYDFFQDEASRSTIIDRMRMYLTGYPPPKNSTSDCYYEEGYISLTEGEVFVDAGASNGDTVEAFIAKMQYINKTYKHIHAFEPGFSRYEQAQGRLVGHANIELVQKGLWSSVTNLQFFENKDQLGASTFLNTARKMTQSLPVTKLDAHFVNVPHSHWPTFIKMDIEGSEKEALLGASEVIRRNKPKLAICAYHRPEDIYELPQTIIDIRHDYRFALRTHWPTPFDTVLYAV